MLSVNGKPLGTDPVFQFQSLLRALRTADLTANTSLVTSSGSRVYISRYEPPRSDGLGARLYFPRWLPDGKPFITGLDKKVAFEMALPLLTEIASRFKSSVRMKRIWQEFDLKKMVFEGQLEI